MRYPQAALSLCLLCCASLSARDEIIVNAEVKSQEALDVQIGDERIRARIAAPFGSRTIPVEIDIVLDSALQPCQDEPELCSGIEICTNGVDDDGDGAVDIQDADCLGVQGYTLAVATDPKFHIRPDGPVSDGGPEYGASFLGTVSDVASRPPGRVRGAAIYYVDVINPNHNEGTQGALGVCVLSLDEFAILDPIGTFPVMKIRGDIDVSHLTQGERSEAILIDIRGPGEGGIASLGQPTETQITVAGGTHPIRVLDLELVVEVMPAISFRRGDGNNDGQVDISDALSVINWLFLGGPQSSCLDSADSDDNGRLELTDGIVIFEFLFYGGVLPPIPGPFDCGIDATLDDVSCEAYFGC